MSWLKRIFLCNYQKLEKHLSFTTEGWLIKQRSLVNNLYGSIPHTSSQLTVQLHVVFK